ncbi:Uncharacterised protein [Vibrio cholerae]|nr:Uncharacterised protein [Vibrio cholerae]
MQNVVIHGACGREILITPNKIEQLITVINAPRILQ